MCIALLQYMLSAYIHIFEEEIKDDYKDQTIL